MVTLADLGQKLKGEREAKGLTLNDIADKIKVSVRILRLIEEGNTKGLPHAVYTRGFIVSYASVLAFDKEELLAALDIVFPSEDMDEAYPEPIILSPSRNMGGSIRRLVLLLVFFAIVASIAFGGWFLYNTYGETLSEIIKKPFSAVSTSLEPEYNVMQGKSQTDNSGLIVSDKADALGLPQEQALISNSANGAGSESQPQESIPVLVASIESNTNQEENLESFAHTGKQELTIHSRARCWVRVQIDGDRFEEFTTSPGEDRKVEFKNKLNITLGNPAGVGLSVNGKPYTGDLKSNRPVTIEFP